MCLCSGFHFMKHKLRYTASHWSQAYPISRLLCRVPLFSAQCCSLLSLANTSRNPSTSHLPVLRSRAHSYWLTFCISLLVCLLFEWIPKVLFVNSFSVERSLDAVCLFPSERGAGSPGPEGAPDCLSWWILRVVCAAESQVMRYVCKKGLVASSKLDWLLCLQLNCFVEEQDWNLETRKLLEA